MNDGPFRIDGQGNLVGPGVFIKREQQHPRMPGVIMLTVDQVNRLYAIGAHLGRADVLLQQRRQKDRISSVLVELGHDSDEPPP